MIPDAGGETQISQNLKFAGLGFRVYGSFRVGFYGSRRGQTLFSLPRAVKPRRLDSASQKIASRAGHLQHLASKRSVTCPYNALCYRDAGNHRRVALCLDTK